MHDRNKKILKYVTLKIRQYRTITIIAIELNNVNLFKCREYRKSKARCVFRSIDSITRLFCKF